MKPEDAEEYTQSLGQIFAGSWRQIALANKLGVPKALGMRLDEWVKEIWLKRRQPIFRSYLRSRIID